jgi:hypothetical protein
MPLAGADPVHLIAGLVAQMHLVAEVGRERGARTPGRPDVPTYGREIHYANLRDVIPLPQLAGPAEEQSKYEVLGAHWPSRRDHGTMRRAHGPFADAMRSQRFKAVVFDYDGTLCSSQSKDGPPSPERRGASGAAGSCRHRRRNRLGRGGSIQSCLQEVCR